MLATAFGSRGCGRFPFICHGDEAEAQRSEYKCKKHHTTWESVAGSDTSIPQAFEQLVPRALPQNSRSQNIR